MLSDAERTRYSRHLLLPELGVAGQERLTAARVLVIGAGGLGSPASLYLAAAGVGTLGIVDHDRIELSNLQRQVLFDSADVGEYKALVAGRRLQALNPGIRVQAHVLEVDAGNVLGLFGGYDLVVDGSDRLVTRYLVNDCCVIARLPLVSAAIHRFEGQAMSYRPGAGPCYRCLFPRSDAAVAPDCATAGVLGVLPGMLGTLQAAEAIKLITGIGTPLLGRLLTLDALEMSWREFRFARRADCAACGEQPTILSPRDSVACSSPVAVVTAADLQRLAPAALARLLRGGGSGDAPLLIDVREPREFAAGHLPGAANLPLGDLPGQIAALAPDRLLVFICRSGARSEAAAGIAARAGRESLAHLEGGMLAWAAQLDPRMTVAPPP